MKSTTGLNFCHWIVLKGDVNKRLKIRNALLNSRLASSVGHSWHRFGFLNETDLNSSVFKPGYTLFICTFGHLRGSSDSHSRRSP